MITEEQKTKEIRVAYAVEDNDGVHYFVRKEKGYYQGSDCRRGYFNKDNTQEEALNRVKNSEEYSSLWDKNLQRDCMGMVRNDNLDEMFFWNDTQSEWQVYYGHIFF